MTPLLPDSAVREGILTRLDTTLLVEASAGTGKTTNMVGRMIALIEHGKCDVSRLAAVTFTRKAAAELRSRFQSRLGEKAALQVLGDELVEQDHAPLQGVEAERHAHAHIKGVARAEAAEQTIQEAAA